MADFQIPAFTVTSLLLTAAICLVAVLAAVYTLRRRIKPSQVILGLFCYVLVLLLQSVLSLLMLNLGVPDSGMACAVSVTAQAVISLGAIRYLGLRFGIKSNFDSADAALGFAVGFAGLYLLACALNYFSSYAMASEYVKTGAEAFALSAGEDAPEMLSTLEEIAGRSGWAYLLLGVNRVFFLVRELAFCVMLWYAMEEDGNRAFLLLVPLMHCLIELPDGLYQAGMLQSSYIKDGVIILLSAAAAFLASRQYNRQEDQVAHFRIEKLRARRRR